LEEEVGEVKFFNDEKGYGFIQREGKADAFAHFTDVSGSDHVMLTKGMRVSFHVRSGRDGRARAYKITVLED
jgi:CspA family cold shock protein